MSNLLSELQRLLGRMGFNEQLLAPLLRKLGQVQAIIDSMDDNSSSVQVLNRLKSQVATWDLSAELEALRGMGLDSSITSQITTRFQQFQSQVSSTTLTEQEASNLINSFNQANDQLASLLRKELGASGFSESSIMKLLQRLGR